MGYISDTDVKQGNPISRQLIPADCSIDAASWDSNRVISNSMFGHRTRMCSALLYS